MSVLHYQGMANVVANALSKVSTSIVAYIDDGKKESAKEVHQLA